MKRTLTAGIVAAIAVAAAFPIAGQDPVAVDVTVERSYDVPEGGRIEGIGACSITSEAIDCWDMDGAHDAVLAERVQAQFIANPNNEIQLRFRRKNRFLVLKRSGRSGGGNYRTPGGGYMNSMTLQQEQGEPSIELLRISTDKSLTTTGIVATISNVRPDQYVDLEFKKGATATISGRTVKLESWMRVPDSMRAVNSYLPVAGGPQWRVRIVDEANQSFYLNFYALGFDGKPITFVDRKGKPTKAPVGSPLMTFDGRPPLNPATRPAFFQFYGFGNEAPTFLSNIDPGTIKTLRTMITFERKVQINGFPLDPKS